MTEGNEPSHICPVCRGNVRATTVAFSSSTAAVQCPRCGKFEITESASKGLDGMVEQGVERFRLCAALRSASDQGSPLTVNTYNARDLSDAVVPPRTLMEGIDRLLEVVNRRSRSPTEPAPFDPGKDYPLVVARDEREAAAYVKKAVDLGFLEPPPGATVRLDIGGWRRLDQITRERPRSDQAFVAMSFNEVLRDAWKVGIWRALDELGWTPIRVDEIEHNDKIDDRIVAEIRRSGLVVADFTGHRQSVYFEAGLAMGLGLPVVYLCREDSIEEAHFDTRQYNHIVWSTPEDLYDRLKARLEATTLRASGRRVDRS